ncbi:uncharacterized protein LOC131438137 [Malaya genurostris]|uniref:uncharacterized protein LOC131425245 n=1 Tax=Malaya genurostris TaxID=325434 RepID=UPI0026F3ACBE|nr:uncharacterized protein LOC131425245 [Malaya genurostris]XP_058463940.1 uncharacterized protein LOC131438137 [Malaya genurostris]
MSRTMCYVPDCKNRYRPDISFHSFPKKSDKKRYMTWLQRLRIKIEPTKTARVCSSHFSAINFFPPSMNRTTQRLILRPSAIPDTNLPCVPTTELKQKLIDCRSIRASNRQNPEKRKKARTMSPEVNSGKEFNEVARVMVEKHIQVDSIDLKNLHLKRTLAISFENDDELLAWTGLKSRIMLDSIVKAIMLLKQYRDKPHSSVSLEEEVLIVFIKLKTNLTFRCISGIFRLHSQTISSCFHRTLPYLSAALKPLIYWPSEKQIANNTPYYFRPDFEDVVAVLDCTEISIMKPKCLHCRINTYSHYKSRETAKYLVGVSPGGSIIYISAGYGGKTSDKQIVLEEKVLDRFKPGQAVMTDKGFMIGKECEQKGIKLVRPPFLHAPAKQLSRMDATLNISIAAARVHVERAIQRIRIFSFFNSKVDSRFVPVLDELIIIACAIVNLSNPILSNKRF